MKISEAVRKAHAAAHKKGFYPNPCNPPCPHCSGSTTSAIMLIVCELAEAVEAIREGDAGALREELADVAIRLFDLAGAESIDLEAEIVGKMRINAGRPFRHSKAF